MHGNDKQQQQMLKQVQHDGQKKQRQRMQLSG
jgi:hypothetical protein